MIDRKDTEAGHVFEALGDCFPSERPDLFERARRVENWDGSSARYEFPDGSAIIAGHCCGDRVVNALGFMRSEVALNDHKAFASPDLWREIVCKRLFPPDISQWAAARRHWHKTFVRTLGAWIEQVEIRQDNSQYLPDTPCCVGARLAGFFKVAEGNLSDFVRGAEALARWFGVNRAELVLMLREAGLCNDPFSAYTWRRPPAEVFGKLAEIETAPDTENQDFRHCQLTGARLSGARLSGIEADFVHFDRSDMEGAQLEKARLYHADFYNTNLRHANLRGAFLRCANLERADLSFANLDGAYLGGALLDGAVLTGTIYERRRA